MPKTLRNICAEFFEGLDDMQVLFEAGYGWPRLVKFPEKSEVILKSTRIVLDVNLESFDAHNEMLKRLDARMKE